MTWTYDHEVKACHKCGLPVKENWYTRHLKSHCIAGIHMTKEEMVKRIQMLENELERLQETIHNPNPTAI